VSGERQDDEEEAQQQQQQQQQEEEEEQQDEVEEAPTAATPEAPTAAPAAEAEGDEDEGAAAGPTSGSTAGEAAEDGELVGSTDDGSAQQRSSDGVDADAGPADGAVADRSSSEVSGSAAAQLELQSTDSDSQDAAAHEAAAAQAAAEMAALCERTAALDAARQALTQQLEAAQRQVALYQAAAVHCATQLAAQQEATTGYQQQLTVQLQSRRLADRTLLRFDVACLQRVEAGFGRGSKQGAGAADQLYGQQQQGPLLPELRTMRGHPFRLLGAGAFGAALAYSVNADGSGGAWVAKTVTQHMHGVMAEAPLTSLVARKSQGRATLWEVGAVLVYAPPTEGDASTWALAHRNADGIFESLYAAGAWGTAQSCQRRRAAGRPGPWRAARLGLWWTSPRRTFWRPSSRTAAPSGFRTWG